MQNGDEAAIPASILIPDLGAFLLHMPFRSALFCFVREKRDIAPKVPEASYGVSKVESSINGAVWRCWAILSSLALLPRGFLALQVPRFPSRPVTGPPRRNMHRTG